MNSLPNVEYVFSVFEIILFFVFLLTNNPYKNTMSHSIIKTNCPLYWPSKCTHSQSQSPYLSESSKLFGFKTQSNLIKCLIISTAPARIVEDAILVLESHLLTWPNLVGFLNLNQVIQNPSLAQSVPRLLVRLSFPEGQEVN